MFQFLKKKKVEEPPKPVSKPAAPKVPEVPSTRKVEKFNIAGTSFREDEIIKNFAEENDEYNLPARELKEIYEDGGRVYKYDFLTAVPEIRPEPENEHDPNAIAVYSDGIQIGYIKSGSTAHLRKVLKDRNIISMKLNITGGDYKDIFDGSISKEKRNIHADLVITHDEK